MNKVLLIFVIIIMTMLGSLGGFFFKRSSSNSSENDGMTKSAIAAIILNKNLYIGGFIYVASALINVWVLKQHMDISVLMPMTAITYIWTMVLSRIALKEKITIKKMIGIALIIVGAVFISL